MTSFWHLLDWRASLTPDAVAADDERDRSLTFAELRDAAVGFATVLAGRGVVPDASVAWMLPTTLESLVVIGALARLGAVQVPLVTILRERDTSFIARATGARHLLVPGVWRGFDYEAMAHRVASEVDGDLDVMVVDSSVLSPAPGADRGRSAGAAVSLPPVAPFPPSADEAPVRWIFFTSGTTSEPKGTMHTDATVLACGIGMNRRFETTADDRNGLVFPIAHIGGPTTVAGGLMDGYRQVLLEAFVGEASCHELSRRKATLIGGGPAFWATLRDAQLAQPREPLFPHLRAVLGGGAAKPVTLHDEVQDALGVPLATGYGSTECPAAMHSSPSDPDADRRSDGRPIEGLEVRIVRADGSESEAEIGEVGEIRLRGTMLFRGYLDPKHDRDAFDADGWYRSGDLGRLDEGGHVWVTGRLKDIIIRKGENISAKEIEDVLARHPAVRDVSVIGLSDVDRGERCCAVVVPVDRRATFSLDDVVAHCLAHGVTTQKIPEQLELVDELPRNPTGKVLKSELQQRFHDPSKLRGARG
jgi:acyl-CoA synthetase (AMP-forming)/AMP-acid ligase II